jgi:hypothetical protein
MMLTLPLHPFGSKSCVRDPHLLVVVSTPYHRIVKGPGMNQGRGAHNMLLLLLLLPTCWDATLSAAQHIVVEIYVEFGQGVGHSIRILDHDGVCPEK